MSQRHASAPPYPNPRYEIVAYPKQAQANNMFQVHCGGITICHYFVLEQTKLKELTLQAIKLSILKMGRFLLIFC